MLPGYCSFLILNSLKRNYHTNFEVWQGYVHFWDPLYSCKCLMLCIEKKFISLFCLPADKNLVKIDLMDWDGKKSFAFYENFRITDEAVITKALLWNYIFWRNTINRGWYNWAFYKFSLQDKYRLQYGQYSGKAGDALTGGGGMVEQWSSSLSGMQFSTGDQVSHLHSFFRFQVLPIVFFMVHKSCWW